MSISLRIKELREHNGLSRKDFSTKIGIDNSQYGKIEAGKLTPTIQQILDISSIFAVSTDWLLSGKLEEVKNNQKTGDIDGNNVVGSNINGNGININGISSDLVDVIKKQQEQISSLIETINKLSNHV
jgi:transcriptional regulator with XRE-family HTH domain